jgi:hypothetical protein
MSEPAQQSHPAARRSRRTANVYRSTLVCEGAEQQCEDALEQEQRMRLPSTGRFL